MPTAGGNAAGRTRIRIIQYSIYGDRGVWIAKRLRSLWNRGCDIKLIYAVSSRPVMSILRNGSGRGSIPVRQSVITNGKREIVKYNHSKWMTITGRYGGSTGAFVTMSGSANLSMFAFTGDEQVQPINERAQALRHMSVQPHLGPGELARPRLRHQGLTRAGSPSGCGCGASRRSRPGARASTSTSAPRASESTRDMTKGADREVGALWFRRSGFETRCTSRRRAPVRAAAPQPLRSPAPRKLGAALTGTGRCWRPCRWSGRARCPACR